MKQQTITFSILLFSCLLFNIAVLKGEEIAVEAGKKVSFDYILTVDGKVVDSTKDRGPLEYTHGEGKIIPGLARQLEGLHVGDSKVITVQAQEAYGLPDRQAFKEVDKASLPKEAELKVGTPIRVGTPEGKSFIARISEVKDKTVILDFNHPLAGKTLEFNIKIVSIK